MIRRNSIPYNILRLFIILLLSSSMMLGCSQEGGNAATEEKKAATKEKAEAGLSVDTEIGEAPEELSELETESEVKIYKMVDGELVEVKPYYMGEDYILIEDFEDGDIKNNLGGDSGAWNLDPDDMDAYGDIAVVDMEGMDGSKKSLKIIYDVDTEKAAQCGYWTKLKALNAMPYDHLEFDIKGDPGETFSTIIRVELKKYKDMRVRKYKLTGMYTVENITDQWQRIRIPLTYFNGLYDKTQEAVWQNPNISMKDLDEFVIVLHKREVDDKEGAIYIDNIKFITTGEKTPSVFDRPPSVAKDKEFILLDDPSYAKEFLVPSEKAEGGYEKIPVKDTSVKGIRKYLESNPKHILLVSKDKWNFKLHLNEEGKFRFISHEEYQTFLSSRLRGFPTKVIVRKEFPADDNEFLREIAKDTWAFFDNIIDAKHGLPLDTLSLGKDRPLGEGGWVGDYTNVTNIGIYLCCIVAAYDLGFITKEDAIERLNHTLTTVKNMDVSEWGFLYNYYDTTWATRTEYFISLVDSGWLVAGMYVAKNAFPEELGALCDELINRGDFGFFYDPVEQQMWHGYYENMNEYVDYHYGIFYTEPRLTSFIAIGKGDVEEAHWFQMVRTFPAGYVWTTQKPKARFEKEYNGIKYWGGWYEYGDHKFVPSWGGSMFEALMPTLLLDERTYAPQSLGINDETHVRLTIDYTLNELGYPIWGMSPSSVPKGGYSEYGVKPLGAMGYKPGVATPHATFLALEFAPAEAIANLRRMLEGWDVYGEYGFYDALDPLSKDVAYKYLSLDQGMILIALDNYLNDGAIRKRFQSDPVFERAKHLLSAENFFEAPPPGWEDEEGYY